ncbi:MAG TPA: carboxypeptidase-like regulatory domain-containing protein, partial [Bacteroidia bacterium]|nr:carboxypeptidase-like regulatory domain-containing protein [Bacteroidia bacterium]
MKKILFIIFAFSSVFFRAQELTQTIRGTVVDKQTQSPLYGAVIQVLAMDGKNTLSDENGKFRIENVSIGRRQIKISLLSYKERIYTLNLTTGKEIVLNAELEES